ncbi:MAG: TetR/AcrR family transcriptional regulator [Myxococcota bacterium]|nr:TetR/AcrR family transcriptional regulator [Myxococcota bacterium]
MTKKHTDPATGARRPAAKTTDGRELRSHKTRQKIQSAALLLFAKHGFGNVTVDSIAAAAKVAKATFYLHFSRKEDLLLAYAERSLRRAAAMLPEVIMRPTVAAAVSEMVAAVLKGRAWTPDLVRVILIELETSYDRLHTRDLRQLLLPLIEIGVARGELRTDIPQSTLAGFVADAIYNALRNWGMESTGEDLDLQLDHAVILALDAIRQR